MSAPEVRIVAQVEEMRSPSCDTAFSKRDTGFFPSLFPEVISPARPRITGPSGNMSRKAACSSPFMAASSGLSTRSLPAFLPSS